MSADGGDISVQEAKARLVAWSEQADAATREEIQGVLTSVKHGAAKAIPWVGGGALLMGLLMGRGKRDKERSTGAIGNVVRVARTGIQVATFVLPLVRSFLASRRAGRE